MSTTDQRLMELRLQNPDFDIQRKPNTYRSTDDPLVTMYPKLEHRDYLALFKQDGGIPLLCDTVHSPGMRDAQFDTTAIKEAQEALWGKEEDILKAVEAYVENPPDKPWAGPMSSREISRKFANQFSDKNLNGVPTKRGK